MARKRSACIWMRILPTPGVFQWREPTSRKLRTLNIWAHTWLKRFSCQRGTGSKPVTLSNLLQAFQMPATNYSESGSPGFPTPSIPGFDLEASCCMVLRHGLWRLWRRNYKTDLIAHTQDSSCVLRASPGKLIQPKSRSMVKLSWSDPGWSLLLLKGSGHS